MPFSPTLPPRLLWLWGFARHVLATFAQDRCLQTAASLAYTSLLALVPMTAVAFGFIGALPVFEGLGDTLNDFVFDNFVPAAGAAVREHLQRFAGQASRLTTVGTLFLVITALMLLRTIDRAFNDIWRVKRHRRGISAFLAYWAVLTLGPVLVGISLAVTSYLVSLPLISDTAASLGLRRTLLASIPFLLTTLAFALVYAAIPNRRVSPHHALIGGLLAALLFEGAKRGFAWYVTNFPAYEVIYGALASIPIFLVWVYLSWLIILFGAEVTHGLESYRHGVRTATADLHEEGFVYAFHLLGHLERAQREGRGLLLRELLGRERSLHEEGLARLLERLEAGRWVSHDEGGRYRLARDLDDTTLLDLHQALPWRLPEVGVEALRQGEAEWNRALAEQLGRGHGALEEGLAVPIRRLLRNPASP